MQREDTEMGGQRPKERGTETQRGGQRPREGGQRPREGGQRPREGGQRPQEGDRDPERGDRDPEIGTETQREKDRLTKDRGGGGDRDPGEVKTRMGKWGDAVFSWDAEACSPTSFAQTCWPHIADLAAGAQEVQVPEGICGLLRGVQVTVPYGHHGCPKCILHSHRGVGAPGMPTLAQSPPGWGEEERRG